MQNINYPFRELVILNIKSISGEMGKEVVVILIKY